MWIAVRNLNDALQQLTDFTNDDAVSKLLAELEKHKWRLQNITKNTAKSASDRAKIANPSAEVEIGNDGTKVPLDQGICTETQIISDIFNMNEVEALELVLTGDVQVNNFDGLNRGLVSVVCYYDAHRLLATTLKTMLEWNNEDISPKLVDFVNRNLINRSLLKHLIQTQASFTVNSEFHMLMQPHVNGLGGAVHQSILRTMIEDIRRLCAENVYLLCQWAGEKSREFMKELLPVLKSFSANDKLLTHHITAWTCVTTLLTNKCLLQNNHSAGVLMECKNQLMDETSWSDMAMHGSISLALSIAVRNVSLSPADHSATSDGDIDVTSLLEKAIQCMCFHFVRYCILGHEGIRNIPQQIVVVDGLLKGFILLFPAKMMELLRNGTDELNIMDEIRETKGVVSMQTHHEHFHILLSSLSEVYRTDQHRASIYPVTEQVVTQLSQQFSPDGTLQLCHFIELARRPQHAVHAVAFLQLLRDITRTPDTANFIFDMFYHLPPHSEDWFSWNSFVVALRQYEKYFRQTAVQMMPFGQNPEQIPAILSEEELAGLIAWIQLAEKVARLDDQSCQVFVDDRNWALIEAATSVISARVPIALKGALLRLLASISRTPQGASRIWAALDANAICSQNESGKMTGLIQELEERECVDRSYDCSLGMAHLLRALFAQPNLPPTAQPYVQFCALNVLAPMSTRSYNSVQQMWELCEVCMDALYWILLQSHAEPRSVSKKEPHVFILLQLLNDTALFRTIGWVLCEDNEAASISSSSTLRLSSSATLSALRLLHAAVTRMAPLRTAIRACDADAIVSTMEALLMSPLPQNNNQSILGLLFSMIGQHNDLPIHALVSMQIVRELCSIRPSLQSRIVELLKVNSEVPARLIRTAYSILEVEGLQYTVEDVLLKDNVDFVDDVDRVRGETARLLLEILADSLDTDCSNVNLCYQMLGIDMRNHSGLLYSNMSTRTGFHRLLDLFGVFISSDDPFQLPCSALLQPSFRLMRGLISVEAPVSPVVLRYLRINDFIYRLTTSTFMGLHAAIVKEDLSSTRKALSDMIAGNILHLVALEVSSLLVHGHYTEPQRILRALLETVDGGADGSVNQTAMTRLPTDRNVLFALLQNTQTAVASEVPPPNLIYFDGIKLQKLLDCCLRTSTWGVPLYDIEHIHFLLKREIVSLGMEDATAPTREMEQILTWSTSSNDRWLMESSHSTLLSGCTAFLSVIALFSPLPFFTNVMQVQILRDASFELISVLSTHYGQLANVLSGALHRLCKAMRKVLEQEKANGEDRRIILSQLLAPLFELMVQPGERTMETKMSLYGAARLCVSACYIPPGEKTSGTNSDTRADGESWLFRPLNNASEDPIRTLLDGFTQELVSYLAADIGDLPLEYKSCPLILLSDLLWEDSLGSRKMAVMVAKSGLIRYIVEIIDHLSINFSAVSNGDGEALKQYRLFRTIMLCLTRVSLVESGWSSLCESGTVGILANLSFLSQPPKDLFLQPTCLNNVGCCGWAFIQCLDLTIHFVVSMTSNTHWKRITPQILDLVVSQCELLCQLIRADVSCKVLDCVIRLLRFVYDNDDSVRASMDQSTSLRMIRNHQLSKGTLPSIPLQPKVNVGNVPSTNGKIPTAVERRFPAALTT